MSRRVELAVALAVLAAPVAGEARVAQPTPEQQVMIDRQNALENAVRELFSDATFNSVRSGYGSIIVADERRGAPTAPRVLVKDENGWNELVPGGKTRRLDARISRELDRYMLDGDLWRENPYVAGQPCPGPTRVFVLRHWNQGERYGRQPCASEGLAGRVAEIAATLRVPARPAVTTAAREPTDLPPGVPEAEYRAGRQMHALLEHSVWAWERRSLAGFVDPFADNVIVEMPGLTLRGRPALIAWARKQQRWMTDGTYAPGTRMTLHRSEWPRPQKDHAIARWEVRWGEEQGRPMRRTYSATWRNDGGLWRIAHMKVSEDKPVTGQRQVW